MRAGIRAFALLMIGVLVAIGAGLWSFSHDTRTVIIGAHTTTVSPTFDSHATFDFGPLLPRMRLPTDQPAGLGVEIRVGDTDASDVNQLVVRDAVIASQPQGEIARIKSTVREMVVSAALRGAGFGLLAVLLTTFAWRAVGPSRRQELHHVVIRRRRPTRTSWVTGSVGVIALALGIGLIVWPMAGAPESASAERGWRPLQEVYPDLQGDEILDRIELSRGGATNGGLAVVDSAIATYQTSVKFYGDMRDEVDMVADQLRDPSDDETVAMVVTDRHDNIGMDPVAGAVGRAAKASVLIDLGDDTSSGGSWEAFSFNSLGRQFKDLEKVGIAGNHDNGAFATKALKDKGFTVLSGDPVDVAGISFLGDSDPRSSGLTAGYSGRAFETIEEQDERLTDVACKDGGVSTLVVHSPSTGTQAAESGCVDLILSGHLHRQVGPDQVLSAEGRTTTTYANASTGGAVYAFALGSKLRRPAQVTLVTYADGRPAGLQPVDFDPSGSVTVQAYLPLSDNEPPIALER